MSNRVKLKFNLGEGIPKGPIGEVIVKSILEKEEIKYKYQAVLDNKKRADFLIFVDKKVGFLEVWSMKLDEKVAKKLLDKYYRAEVGGTPLTFGWIVCSEYEGWGEFEDIELIKLEDFKEFLSNFETGRISKVLPKKEVAPQTPKKKKKKFFSNFHVVKEKRVSPRTGEIYEKMVVKRKPLVKHHSDILKHLYGIGVSLDDIEKIRLAMGKQYGARQKRKPRLSFYQMYIQGNNYDSATRMLCNLINIPFDDLKIEK